MLVAAVMRTDGPVLELGAGLYSTPILHEICRAQNRLLVTCDRDQEWLKKFEHLAIARSRRVVMLRGPDPGWESSGHILVHVPDWARFATIDKYAWSVAFVDHSPGERRKIEVERLRAKTEYIVVHDTEPSPLANYGLAPVFATFKFRRDFSSLTPWTTVVSDRREIWLDAKNS